MAPGRPCYAPAALVLVRPSGHTLRFTCEHTLVMIQAFELGVRSAFRLDKDG